MSATAPIDSNPLEYTDVSEPNVSTDEVLIRVLACGVCRSNLHMIEGDWLPGLPSRLPIIPGHELVGVVEKLGSNVETFTLGQRVGMQPLWWACGKCSPCLSGLDQHCENSMWTGEQVDGGYAEYVIGKSSFIYNVPHELDDDKAAPLFCAGLSAFNATRKASPKEGRLIAIFGIGGLGHLSVELTKMMGAKVVAVSRSEEHLKLAKKVGADHVINSTHEDPVKEIRNLGGADATILFVPSRSVALDASRSTKPCGTLVVATNVEFPFPKGRELTVIGTEVGTRKQTNEFLEYAVKQSLYIETERHPLREANSVLKALKNSEIRGRAVLIP